MNQTPENETEAIRSDIDSTRRRMDETMGAIGERLQGRHLVDEILGFFRSGSDRGRELGEKLSRSASSAVHSVTDSVKANPVPALLIGAGVAWMIYSSRRSSSSDLDDRYDDAATAYDSLENQPDAESLYDRPLEYPSSSTVQNNTFEESSYSAGPTMSSPGGGVPGSGSKVGQAKDKIAGKASQATQQVKEKLSNVGSAVRDRTEAMRSQARDMTSRVQERARQTYRRSRERVVHTANEHPLEIGLACLAAGVIAGISLPTPRKLDEVAGPSVDRLRDRARQTKDELVEKGKRVAHAAADAVKNEAEAQGLTMDHLRDQASAVAGHAKEAAAETAQQEGLTPSGGKGHSAPKPAPAGGSPNRDPAQPPSDPLASRPVM